MPDLQTELQPLVKASNLVKYYSIRGGVFHKEIASVKAVDGVSMTIRQGETVGLVGESGCGKTTFGRAILRLEEPTSGEVFFEGENILAYDY
ncbi:MAG: ABC transporter ATP-binding protein, partial [Desulfobulbaceae bacterium]|nr:ABC transporter ATP-binding protein [Desulfobulbaceae bacterium]